MKGFRPEFIFDCYFSGHLKELIGAELSGIFESGERVRKNSNIELMDQIMASSSSDDEEEIEG